MHTHKHTFMKGSEMSQLVTAMGSAAPNARSEALPHMLGNFMKLDNLLFFLVLGPSQA